MPADIGHDADHRRSAAKRARRGRARQRQAFVGGRTQAVDRVELSEAIAALSDDAPIDTEAGPAPLGFPANNAQRWVPIGPSVVRRGQATDRPRVTGRIREIAVEPTAGLRAYAATAKGGVWYTRDGGSSWEPIGGWTAGQRGTGGQNSVQSCGCVLVSWGVGATAAAAEAADIVMVGTGEPTGNAAHETVPTHGSVGVLTAVGPATAAVGSEPWESESGLAALQGLGIFRLARDPASVPGKTANPNRDRVVAATTNGLFLGLRTRVPAAGTTPQHDEYRWTPLTVGLNALVGNGSPQISDVLWLPGGANGRIVVSITGPAGTQGVAVSTNVGVAFTPVAFAQVPTPNSRTSLARAGATNRVYVLGEHTTAGPTQVPDVWQIPSIAAAAPVATAAANGAAASAIPNNLWPNQRDYDQAIAVDVVGTTDRIYIGGSVVLPTATGEWSAALFAFHTSTVAPGPAPPPPALPPPGVWPAFTAVPTLSATQAPPVGAGADVVGLIGNNVHGDVHSIVLAGPAANRQVWVGCDGGVFRSTQAGRVNSFQARQTGLAALEVGFHASHPTSSHFGIVGSQDNGAQVRIGDTVWEETFVGDGGGVAFHPTRSQYVIVQWTSGSWYSQPTAGFHGPIGRVTGGTMLNDPNNPSVYDPEDTASAFYSGVDAIARTATESRVAIGTNRVWLSDDIGVAAASSSWRVIGFPNGPGADQPGPAAAASGWVGLPQRGAAPAVAAPASLGPVIRLRWASPTNLLALYQTGIVRYTQAGANWTATIITPGTAGEPTMSAAGNELFTDIFPLPMTAPGVASNDFYLTTTGNTGNTATDTCFFFDSANNRFVATNLRRVLDPTPPPPASGPLDPAYAVVVDPTAANTVYVGTVTGVWRGVRAGAAHVHAWTRFANGLPEAPVQDLTVWTDPGGAATPRLLRASIQSRGVWEVDLATPNEPQRTYVRVHERDDRRRFPTPMQNPRRRATAPAVPAHASPDIAVRPQWPRPAATPAPRWLLGGSSIAGNAGRGYQLWTFQTAFRWHYPSVVADGEWTDQLGDLIQFHRVTNGLGSNRRITRDLWDAVVGGTRLTPQGAVSNAAANPLAVYRPPWQSVGALTASATEIDIVETVVPQATRSGGTIWRVHNEPVTVDVLLHHRDSRPLPANDAFAIVLWRSAPSQNAALGPDVSSFPAFARSLLTAAPAADPAGWNVAADAAGSKVHRLPQPLDARLPRAVSVDIDLSGVARWHRVLVVAIVGSNTDPMTVAPTTPMNVAVTPGTLVANWPHAGMRLVQMVRRP